MGKKKTKSFWARLFVIGALLGGTTGCATQYKIVEGKDPKTGEIRRYYKNADGKEGDPVEWEKLRKAKEQAKEEKIRKDAPLWARAVWPLVKPYYKPAEPRKLIPPPGKRVVYRDKQK